MDSPRTESPPTDPIPRRPAISWQRRRVDTAGKDMDEYEFLALASELAIAITGFSGIIATFQFRADARLRRSDVVGLNLIVQLSLVGVFGFLLPLFLHAVGVSPPTVWTAASVVEVASGLFIGVGIDQRMRGALRKRSSLALIGALQLIGAVIVVLNLMNVFGVVFNREPAPFLIASIWVMSLSCFLFARLLMRPVWRALESATPRDDPSMISQSSDESPAHCP